MKHHRKLNLTAIPMLGLAVGPRRATRERQARAITPGADATRGASASTAPSHSSGEECAQ